MSIPNPTGLPIGGPGVSARAKRQRAKIDGAALLNRIEKEALEEYLFIGREQRTAVVLWAAFSHAFDAFTISPMLLITSPEKRCGKTTLLLILRDLVRDAHQASSASAASLYHIIEEKHPTLLLDETDQWWRSKSPMTGIVNGSHVKHTATVIRCKGRKNRTGTFSTWCPKVIVGKDDSGVLLDDTTADRCIRIELKRKLAGEPRARFRIDLEHFIDLRRELKRWTDASLKALRGADPTVPGELHDRAADNWRPLLAIADLAGGDWPQRAREAAIALTPNAAEDDSKGRRLMRAIAAAIIKVRHEVIYPHDWSYPPGINAAGHAHEPVDHDAIFSDVLADEVSKDEARAAHRDGKLNQHTLAAALHPYGIAPLAQRLRYRIYGLKGEAVIDLQRRGYKHEWFRDAFARYCPELLPQVYTDEPCTGESDAARPATD